MEHSTTVKEICALLAYAQFAQDDLVVPRQHTVAALPESQQNLVPFAAKHLDSIRKCVEANQLFWNEVCAPTLYEYNLQNEPMVATSFQDYTKVKLLFAQVVREWSSEGSFEREAVFGKILHYFDTEFPEKKLSVLVPGSGLGRLVFEMCKRGHNVQGNELSEQMVLVSRWFLNYAQKDSFTIHPFVHNFSHNATRADQIRGVDVPDVSSRAEFSNENFGTMSMVSGSFVDIYGPSEGISNSTFYSADSSETRNANKESFDSVVTCFFLDTAQNVLDYILTIHNALRPGGTWVNLGPYMWHFEDRQEVSGGLELCRDDIFEICEKVGFVFKLKNENISTGYGRNPKALGGWQYTCDYWVAIKT